MLVLTEGRLYPGLFGTEAVQNSENVKITNTFLKFFSVLCRASQLHFFFFCSFALWSGWVSQHSAQEHSERIRGHCALGPCLPNAPLAICLVQLVALPRVVSISLLF